MSHNKPLDELDELLRLLEDWIDEADNPEDAQDLIHALYHFERGSDMLRRFVGEDDDEE